MRYVIQNKRFRLLRVQGAHQRANLFASTPLVELFFALGYGNFRGRCFRVVATALAFAL